MPIEALAPVPDDAVAEVGTAARPVRSDQLVIGLLANTKRNGPELLSAIAALLEDEVPGARFVGPVVTAGVMLPSEEQLAELVEQCDVVLTGLGDCGSCSATTMHVATDLESRGVPAAAICTEPFLASASAMAARRGFPGYAFARVTHPVSSLDQSEIEERAREALPQVLSILGLASEGAAAVADVSPVASPPPVFVEDAGDDVVRGQSSPTGSDDYDVAVVGGGLAALSAALFSATFGLRTVVVTEIVMGGELINLEEVVHFPGLVEPISGSELASRVEDQALRAGATFTYDNVEEIRGVDGGFAVRGFESEVRARSVIAATGAGRSHLGLDGESELEARGVSYCGTCDGPFFKERSVAVVGDGDFAGRESLVVARYASDVTLITRLAEPELSAATRAAVAQHDGIRVLARSEVVALSASDGVLSGVEVRDLDSDASSELDLAGLFVNTGMEPRSTLLSGLVELDTHGRVRVDAGMRTSVPGLYAVGGLRSDFPGYAVAAAGDGAAAAASVRAELSRGAQAVSALPSAVVASP